MINKVTLVVPTYNNLKHIKNAYTSIRKYYPTLELVLLDDGSSDGTFEWLELIEETDENVVLYQSEERVGHTILYDVGIDMAKNEIIGIIHADMIVSENYLENLLKHLDKGKVVCATRIEPPLHPPGNEKIIQNFGMDFDDLNIPAFEEFVVKAQSEYNNQTSKGMFAPWILYKEDFQSIGGHDPLFAPFPYEDSDIFQRWILAGFELIQSRDSFVYHLTCRGHRWNNEVQKEVSRAAQKEQALFDSGALVLVGVNRFQDFAAPKTNMQIPKEQVSKQSLIEPIQSRRLSEKSEQVYGK